MSPAAIDLGAALGRATSEVDERAVRAALDALFARPSPPGGERALAEDLVRWGSAAHPALAWEVDRLDDRSASVFARSAVGASRELCVYAHLDTSLTGDASLDGAITGAATPAPPLRSDAASHTLRGFGVGVAKAPSAAAIAACAAAARALRGLGVAHRLTLLLAAGGTHRAAPGQPGEAAAAFGRGVTHALERGWRPDAVLNVKAGPPGVLHEEPAAAYLRVRVTRPWEAALARRAVAPDGGLARHAGVVLDAIESWRQGYLAREMPRGQLAAEIAIGALRSGSPDKPDLLPGLLDVFVYAVLMPSEDPAAVARDLGSFVAPRVGALPGAPRATVDVYASAPGGATDASSEIVRLARAAWERHVTAPVPVSGWSGATDGALFLARGIPTARVGVRVTRDRDDPRVEIVSLGELVGAARAYAEVAVRFFAASAA